MGIDGFSMSNLTGVNRNLSSQQLAQDADVTARQGTEDDIVDMDGISRKQKAGRKDPDAAFNGRMVLIKDEEQQQQEEHQDQKQDESKKEKQNKPSDDEVSKYNFRLNKEGMIDICEGEKVVGSISPEDAAKALAQISDFSGSLVNKNI